MCKWTIGFLTHGPQQPQNRITWCCRVYRLLQVFPQYTHLSVFSSIFLFITHFFFFSTVLTSQHTTKALTHKRALSDEASKITTAFPRTNPAVESLKGQTMTQSKSSLCINGSHVYDSEPSTPRISGAHPSKLVLLEKCSPLSRSLQNLTKRSEDKGSFADGRRWSFDKTKKDEKEEEKESQASSPPIQQAQIGGQAATPGSSSPSPDKGRKLRKTLFSGGRSDSLPTKSDLNQAASTSEGRLRGWFGSGDSQNKPR